MIQKFDGFYTIKDLVAWQIAHLEWALRYSGSKSILILFVCHHETQTFWVVALKIFGILHPSIFFKTQIPKIDPHMVAIWFHMKPTPPP